MIHASADRVAEIIASDTEMLRVLNGFLGAIIGENDVGSLIDELPQAVAACSPFKDENAMVEAVKCETLLCLHRLALLRMTPRGNA